MGRYFGTDGIRGPADGPLFEPAFLARVARAIAASLLDEADGKPLHAIIGRDPRASGERIAAALAAGLSEFGIHVFDGGMAPTPAVAKAVIDLQCDLGIVITASHNPADDNGVKLFGPGGLKLHEAREAAIEAYIDEPPPLSVVAGARTFPHATVRHYLPFVRSLIHAGDLQGWRIVVDTANGATCGTTPLVLRELGAEVIALGDQPDGHNINRGVGSEYPEQLARRVKAEGARFGLAHDGDGDRLVVVDETGAVVDGDAVIGALGLFLLHQGDLPKRTVVATVMSNLGLDEAIEGAGGRVLRTGVGDRHVLHALREGGYGFGGESSGHLIFHDLLPTGDGLIAATQLVRMMLMTGRPLSALVGAIRLYPQRLKNLPITAKPPLEDLPGLAAAVTAVERSIPGRGRVLLRYSGTEPKVRLLVEAGDEAALEAGMAALETLVRERLPVAD